MVSRLKTVWKAEYGTWRASRVDKDRWVYLWADGIYSGLRGESDRLCVLVIIGVNERGKKRFLAIEDGVRESKQSWKNGLHTHQARGPRGATQLRGGGRSALSGRTAASGRSGGSPPRPARPCASCGDARADATARRAGWSPCRPA